MVKNYFNHNYEDLQMNKGDFLAKDQNLGCIELREVHEQPVKALGSSYFGGDLVDLVQSDYLQIEAIKRALIQQRDLQLTRDKALWDEIERLKAQVNDL